MLYEELERDVEYAQDEVTGFLPTYKVYRHHLRERYTQLCIDMPFYSIDEDMFVLAINYLNTIGQNIGYAPVMFIRNEYSARFDIDDIEWSLLSDITALRKDIQYHYSKSLTGSAMLLKHRMLILFRNLNSLVH